ncbi:MAG: hypothetical protein GEU98_08860 [Pseudonocardiaceae bacterium]|nr:hypothetical protein [Pseudonocardiaceae bacterium]
MLTSEAEEQLCRRLTTAALRAAVAWSRRSSEPGAWRELSRMTGVVSYVLGPGRGPSTPLELVDRLGKPLSGLFPGDFAVPDELADLVLLNSSESLTDRAIEVGCEYTEALFGEVEDPARAWLPTWAWQRAEQVQRSVFEELISAGDEHAYTATRRFLIENPAGDESTLVQRMNAAGARRVARYDPVAPDRVWPGVANQWWWPCPVRRWPMRIKDEFVECGYSHHEARFRVDAGAGSRSAPRLLKLTSAKLRVPAAQSADRARCLDLAVWRFVTVPGVPELTLERRLLRIDGVSVDMWPGLDRVDLTVSTTGGRRWEVDVKDRSEPSSIAADPPAARDIVVPDYRRGQVNPLRRMLPDKRVWTVTGFVRHVRKRTGGVA